MALISCKNDLILNLSKDCVISSTNGEVKLKIADIMLYVPVVTLSIQDNTKLVEQFKSGFKKIII